MFNFSPTLRLLRLSAAPILNYGKTEWFTGFFEMKRKLHVGSIKHVGSSTVYS